MSPKSTVGNPSSWICTNGEPPVATGKPRTAMFELPPGPDVPFTWMPGIMRKTSASDVGWKFFTNSAGTDVTETDVLSTLLSPPEAVTTISSSRLSLPFAESAATGAVSA